MSGTRDTSRLPDHAELRGKVVAANRTLRAPDSGRECVYWDVRDRWFDEPKEQGAVDFWLHDDEGPVLVLGAHLRVDAHVERGRRVVEAVEADLAALGAHLAALKKSLREVQGRDQAKLQRERRALANLATFLLATKAHAKGRVHVGKSLQAQQQWLEANASAAAVDGFETRTAKFSRETWQVVVEPGHEIIVNGRCTVELLPPEHSRDGGYRQATSGRVLRGTAAAPLLMTGVGVISPERNAEGARRADGAARGRATRSGDPREGQVADRGRWATIAVCAAAVAAAIAAAVLQR